MNAPLSAAAALRAVLAEVEPAGTEPVALGDCLDRVSGAALRSAVSVPAFDNSAMDGFAVRHADLGADRPLCLVGESRAGSPCPVPVGTGEAAWISTGAMLPEGADSVLPLELAQEESGRVRAKAELAPGANVRRVGEDLEAGQAILDPGAPIGPAELGVLASAGLHRVECARRPRVTVLTSGDELRGPGERLAPGEIFDSNRFTLTALARRAGAESRFGGLVGDSREAAVEALGAALNADLVAISGGVSVGRHDHVKEALSALGVEPRFWRLALRPGGPTWFGVHDGPLRRTLVFGLPGNPVSAMVTFHLFARPAILAAIGRDPNADRIEVTMGESYRKAAGKAHFIRCRLEQDEAGWRALRTVANQGSHVGSSLLGADCVAEMPAAATEVGIGERVEARLL